MNKLALQMLCGYNRDREKDMINGEYNPLNSGAWNFEKLKNELVEAILNNPCPEIEEIMNIEDAFHTWWRV